MGTRTGGPGRRAGPSFKRDRLALPNRCVSDERCCRCLAAGLDRRAIGDRALRQHELIEHVRRCILHLAKRLQVEIVDRVAGLVVAVVEREPGRAAEERSLLCGLDLLRAGEDATGRDARVGEAT